MISPASFSDNSDVNAVLQIVVCGSMKSGKTTLVQSFANGFFQDSPEPTTGIFISTKTVLFNGMLIKLKIIEISPQISTQRFYNAADAAIVVLDMSQNNTPEQFIDNIKHNNGKIPISIIGTKADIKSDDFAQTVDFQFTSNEPQLAKQIFLSLVSKISLQPPTNPIKYPISSVLIGPPLSGKTLLLSRLLNRQTPSPCFQTISPVWSHVKHSMELLELSINLKDSPGAFQYTDLWQYYWKDAETAIIVYDAGKADSVEELHVYVDSLRKLRNGKLPGLIVANKKRDTLNEEAVRLGQNYANHNGFGFVIFDVKNDDIEILKDSFIHSVF